MKKLIVILLCLAAVAAADARRRTTTHGQARRSADVADIRMPLDTVVPTPGSVIIAGYDKQRASRHETVFVTNKTGHPIAGLTLAIDYLSADSVVIHRATRSLRIALPDGETRKADFPSWDRQNAFHYHGSRPPRAESTPYDVRINVTHIFIPRGQTASDQ